MTDEQLRAMARRVLGLVVERCPKCDDTGRYFNRQFSHNRDKVDDAAVAIMREEMDKAKQHPLNSVLDDYVMTDDEAEALLALPVTQSVSIDA